MSANQLAAALDLEPHGLAADVARAVVELTGTSWAPMPSSLRIEVRMPIIPYRNDRLPESYLEVAKLPTKLVLRKGVTDALVFANEQAFQRVVQDEKCCAGQHWRRHPGLLFGAGARLCFLAARSVRRTLSLHTQHAATDRGQRGRPCAHDGGSYPLIYLQHAWRQALALHHHRFAALTDGFSSHSAHPRHGRVLRVCLQRGIGERHGAG